jgi:hypothetical protein
MVAAFADALGRVDATRPVGASCRFQPGCGPLTESEVTGLVLAELARGLEPFKFAHPRRYPSARTECDFVIPDAWAVEVKLARPFGDNGKPAERWSENLLYPYAGNTSSLGDCLKLINSGFTKRKAVVVIGYEHTPPRIALEPAIRGFEVLADRVLGIDLSQREQVTVGGLVHPFHRQATVYGWEVRGLREPPA